MSTQESADNCSDSVDCRQFPTVYHFSIGFLLFEMDFCFTTQKVNVANMKRISALIYIQRFVFKYAGDDEPAVFLHHSVK